MQNGHHELHKKEAETQKIKSEIIQFLQSHYPPSLEMCR